jgi:hypothetical protein
MRRLQIIVGCGASMAELVGIAGLEALKGKEFCNHTLLSEDFRRGVSSHRAPVQSVTLVRVTGDLRGA